jgi:hypothetical protein
MIYMQDKYQGTNTHMFILESYDVKNVSVDIFTRGLEADEDRVIIAGTLGDFENRCEELGFEIDTARGPFQTLYKFMGKSKIIWRGCPYYADELKIGAKSYIVFYSKTGKHTPEQ